MAKLACKYATPKKNDMSYEEIELSAHNIIDTVVARIAHNWEGRCDCLGNEKSSAWNFMTFTPNFNPKT